VSACPNCLAIIAIGTPGIAETKFVNGVALLMVALTGLIFVFFRHWPKAQSGS
jgi:hypothetical protein